MGDILKPCPFCGEDVYIERVPIRGYNGCYTFDISCRNPECLCRICLGGNDTVYRSEEAAKQNAIKAWNKRMKTKRLTSRKNGWEDYKYGDCQEDKLSPRRLPCEMGG